MFLDSLALLIYVIYMISAKNTMASFAYVKKDLFRFCINKGLSQMI
jgi:hypothetical protein